jgi:glycosyltransferase involved in cell wall biosynthesis
MGTFYEFSGLPKVIESLAKNKNSEVKLVLVGGGAQESEINSLVNKHQLEDRVICTGVIPYTELPEILSMADVTFNSFEPILISNVAFPHKVLQYLATGIPTISTKLDGLYSALGENAGVIWVNQPDDIINAALNIKNLSKSAMQDMVNKGRKFIEMNFSKQLSVMSFEKTIQQVLEKN